MAIDLIGVAKVLITETISQAGIDQLAAAGHTVEVQLELSEAELLAAVPGCEALIVRSQTQVTAEVLEAAADSLKIVARAGVGVDNVDMAAATQLGVVVANAPQSNSLSAAEHTMGLLLAQARNIPQAHGDLTAGNWNRSEFQGVELSGKTLGIVGFGRIGQLVAERAAGFHMNIVIYDPYIPEDLCKRLHVEPVSLEQLFAQADFVTLHVAKTAETANLVNAELLAKAKPQLRLVNVSRGGVVNEADLAAAIQAGQVAGAALDVFETEPPPADSPLFGLPQVVVTPHLGANTAEAQDKAGQSVASQVAQMLDGQLPRYAVNIRAGQTSSELLAFLPLCEQLGGVFTGLAQSLPATIEIEFSGQIAATETNMGTMAVLVGLLRQVSEQPISYVNAEEVARSRGVTVRAVNTTTPKDYVSEVTVSGGGHEVGGALFGVRSEPHLIRLEGHTVDLPPAEHMVAIRNHDRPGTIGEVGQILGQAGINIRNMDVGVAPSQAGEALIMLSTDTEVGDETAAQLRSLDAVIDVRVINLT